MTMIVYDRYGEANTDGFQKVYDNYCVYFSFVIIAKVNRGLLKKIT